MTNKKLIIIGLAIFVVLFLSLTFYFWNSNNKPAAPIAPENPQYPASSPTVKKNDTAPAVTVLDASSQEDISKTVSGFDSKTVKGMEFTRVTDTNKNAIPLDQFLSSMSASVNPDLKNLLDPNKYYLVSCGENSGKKELGIVLDIKLLSDYKGNLYQDELNIMKKWEPTMLSDLRKIIFPDANFTGEQLKQILNFRDGKYRFSEINLPDNKKDSLNYTIIDDFVIISNSVPCMDKTTKAFIN
jgi:hypothetical protein